MDDKVISILNDLIETSKDGARGFALASKDNREPELTELFRQGEESCHAEVAELQDEVRQLGGVAEEGGSMKATVHRGWINFKAVMISRDAKSILEECERGEDYARARYADAVKAELPERIRAIVERQYKRVVATHGRVRDLRSRFRSIEVPQAARSRV